MFTKDARVKCSKVWHRFYIFLSEVTIATFLTDLFFYFYSQNSSVSQKKTLQKRIAYHGGTQCSGAGAGLFLLEPVNRFRADALWLKEVLRWQTCDNSCKFSQIITIFTPIERKNRYTFKQCCGAGAAWSSQFWGVFDAGADFLVCRSREPEPLFYGGSGFCWIFEKNCTYLPVCFFISD